MGDANGGPGYGGYGGYNGGGFGGYGGNGGMSADNWGRGSNWGGDYGGGRPGPWNQPPGGSSYDQQGSQNAQNLWNQYQVAQPGQARSDLIRQMQAADNGAAFNANMKNNGYVLNAGPGGNYSYSQPGGVSDQVRRMQDAQGLDRQGQPWPTQQWSSQGPMVPGPGNQQTPYLAGGAGSQGHRWDRNPNQQQWSSQGGGYGGYQPGAFGQQPSGSGYERYDRAYGGQGGGQYGGQGGGQPK